MRVEAEDKEMGGEVDPREPEERRQDVPLRDVDVPTFPATEVDEGPHPDEQVAGEQHRPPL